MASEIVEDVFLKKLLVPCSTRWNSFQNAVERITEIPLNDLTTICDRLGLKCFSDRELQFLKEYCSITKPLTTALDIVQGEDNCYYGTLLPTLEVLMAKTLEKKEGLTVAVGLPDAIVQVRSIPSTHRNVHVYFTKDILRHCTGKHIGYVVVSLLASLACYRSLHSEYCIFDFTQNGILIPMSMCVCRLSKLDFPPSWKVKMP